MGLVSLVSRTGATSCFKRSFIIACSALSFAAPATADVINDASLIAFWNATSGAIDATGNGHDGTFHGNATVVPGAVFGNAFAFDGNGDYIDIGDELDMGASDFTLSAWIKGDPSMNDWARILDKGYSSGYTLGRTGNTANVNFEYLNSGTQGSFFSNSGTVIDNAWHHIALVKSGTTVSIYANGHVQNTETVSAAPQNNTNPLFIGYNPGEGLLGYWKGQLDEIAIYNRVLTQQEIVTLGSRHVDFSYPNFANVDGLQLNGDAARVGNALRVAKATGFSGGSAFTITPVSLGAGNSFSTHFQFQITNSGGASDEDGPGADGLVFVIQTVSNNVGSAGGGIGYSGISPSLGIEFDTYNNGSPTFGDPNGNHVGIDLNGDISSVQTQIEPVRFNNGAVWNAWVDFNGDTNQLEARWSMSAVRPTLAQLSRVVDLTTLLGQNAAFLGFTSATGNGVGDHDVLSWEFVGKFAPLPGLPGDYNNDGNVNAADYVIWRKGLGTIYTQSDYDVWRAHFGQTAGSGAGATVNSAVPEPTTLILLVTGMTAICTRRRTTVS
jgi:hypothetical protein